MTPRDTAPAEQAEVLPSQGNSAASKFLAEASNFAGAAKDSFLYSAAQSPVTGVTQIVDHIAGTEWEKSSHVFDAPEEAKFGSAAWHGQQVGAGLGIAADFLVVKKFAGSLTKIVPETERLSTSFAARKAIQRSALTGAVYQGAFSPSQEGNENFWESRLENAGSGALTFGALTGASIGLKSMLGKTQADSTLLSRIARSDAAIGTMAGIPAGLINAESSSLLHGNGLASNDTALKSAYGFVVAGGALGLAKELKISQAKSRESLPSPAENGARLAASGLTATQWGGLKLQWKTFDQLDISAKQFDMTLESSHEITSQRRETLTLQRHSSSSEDTLKVTVPSTVLTLGKRATEIVIPDGDWHGVEGVRAWREFASHFTPEQKADFDKTMARSSGTFGDRNIDKSISGYSSLILPEQLGQFMDELPDQSIVRRIILWPDGGFKTAADAHGSDINIYRSTQIDANDLRHYLFHEWSHVADHNTTNCLFLYAAELEKSGYYARDYAKKNNAENLAVHLGEELLSPDADDFFIFTKNAPIRAVALSEILRQRLANAERGNATSPYHQQFVDRTEYIKTNAVPEAKRALSSSLSGDYAQKMSALLFISQINETDPAVARRLIDLEQLERLAGTQTGQIVVSDEQFTDLLYAAKQRAWAENQATLPEIISN